ncbi:MAG: citrate/2-methylcitrate synthase [Candidatus Omnitrophota bacterium]|nr:citrate/2-methylcitrate synthase [Candidatus Omnitrophota bacterium]
MPQKNPIALKTAEGGFPPSKGLEKIIAGETALSLVDGVEGKLYYSGIPVHEFVDNSSFEEVAYLLWYGKLPAKGELDAFKQKLVASRKLPPEIFGLIERLPAQGHPMAVLRTVISALAFHDDNADDISSDGTLEKAYVLTAAAPTIIAASYRLRQGKKPIEPDPKLSHAANFLYMMHGEVPQPEMERGLDAYLILLADHGFNASTFAARVTAATESDMYSAIASAIGTLKGDLHGSANQRAMEMILAVGDVEKAEAYVSNILDNKKKVMGFGHRVYKEKDPRAEAFRGIAAQMLEKAGERKWMEISNAIEKVMWEKKRIPCNVDFFSASVLYVLGFPVSFFTTVFAASRMAGWTGHVIEQRKDNKLIRPSCVYTGPRDQHYPPIDQRK